MNDLRTAAQQALEFVTSKAWGTTPYMDVRVYEDAAKLRDTIRAALAEQQEPAPMPPFPPVSQWKRGCAVCGIGADGRAYGYVCQRSDCPTRITCGGAV